MTNNEKYRQQPVGYGYTLNHQMREAFNAGKSVEEIAESFGAEVEGVKSVVSKKRISVGINNFLWINGAV